MTIGFVLDDSLDKNDGVQQYVLALGNWMTSQGHDVHYLMGHTKRTDIPNVYSLSRNMKVRFNGNRMSMPLPGRKKSIRRVLQDIPFDILHIQMPYSPFLAARIIKYASPHTAIIGTFHIAPYSSAVSVANKSLSVVLKRSLKRFNDIVSVSQAAADFAKATYGIESEILPMLSMLNDLVPQNRSLQNQSLSFFSSAGLSRVKAAVRYLKQLRY
jgi:phosphatidylinositol alpha-mannosyltransferase